VIDQLLNLMTPQELLDKTELEKAFPIIPEQFPTFDDLLAYRTSIRDLRLLPVKSDLMRAYYHTLDQDLLAWQVLNLLEDDDFKLAKNEYPYVVPEGTDQYIFWIQDNYAPRDIIAWELQKIVIDRGFKLDDLILFERPMKATTLLVKGTFPLVRHMHVWTRSFTSS